MNQFTEDEQEWIRQAGSHLFDVGVAFDIDACTDQAFTFRKGHTVTATAAMVDAAKKEAQSLGRIITKV